MCAPMVGVEANAVPKVLMVSPMPHTHDVLVFHQLQLTAVAASSVPICVHRVVGQLDRDLHSAL